MAFSRVSDYSTMPRVVPKISINIRSVANLLYDHANRQGDKEAIIAVDPDTDASVSISYALLASLVNRVTRFLIACNIKKGSRFAILMHNAPEVLLFELAGAIIGATTVPLDFKRDTLERKIFKLKDTGSQSLFIKSEGPLNQKEFDLVCKAIPNLRIYSWQSIEEFQSMLPHEHPVDSRGSFDDHYIILYTSGTTALPKGVPLSLRACLLNALGIIDWQKFTSSDRFNIVLPLHHINSTEFCLSMLAVGGTIILNARYSASKFWHIISRYKATNTSIVPTILHDLLVRFDEFNSQHPDISSITRICIGSAPVLPQELLRFYETFGIRVIQGYGQTETALRVAGVPVDVAETTYRKLVRINTIGTELANNHLAIMDSNNRIKQEGKEGEICIAGPILADGYLNNPDETAYSFKDGWFHSGDLGYWKYVASRPGLEPRKFFFIIGRMKEIIIKGGVNLSPSAIEDALLKAFAELDEASVVGFPDERMGEDIAAVIVLKRSHLARQGETLQALQARIVDAAQNGTIPGLSRYEAPKKVFIFDNLPKTSTGKIQRVEVKKAVAELIKKERPKHYYVRQISADEMVVIKKAMGINNARFLFVHSSLREFIARAQNGLFWGVFEEHEGLVGSLSCLRLNHAIAGKLKTWNEATANGTLTNNDPNGDTLLCIAISVTSSNNGTIKRWSNVDENTLKQRARRYIKDYVHSGNDHVLEFHRTPKGGIPGATVWKILRNSRPEDKEAMGHNILMKYPTLAPGTKIVRSNAPSPAILLIEHALLYAKEHKIKRVVAFSRPSGFRNYLEKQFMDTTASRSHR